MVRLPSVGMMVKSSSSWQSPVILFTMRSSCPSARSRSSLFAVLRSLFHLLVEVFKSAFVGPHLRFHLKIICQQSILADNIQQELVLDVLLVMLRHPVMRGHIGIVVLLFESCGSSRQGVFKLSTLMKMLQSILRQST